MSTILTLNQEYQYENTQHVSLNYFLALPRKMPRNNDQPRNNEILIDYQ